jgi:hypothetical protein
MAISRRFIISILSILVAHGAMALIDAGHSAAKLLHEWYVGVLALFLISLVILMTAVLRGHLEKSLWAIPVSALLCYPAAAFAYVTYFSLFEPQRFFNSMTQVESSTGTFAFVHLLDMILLIVFWGPTVSLAWLFGILAGAAFLLIARIGRA